MFLFLRFNGMFLPLHKFTLVARTYIENINVFLNGFWYLYFLPLCFSRTFLKAKPQMSSTLVSVLHSSWTIKVPSSVEGLLGSCVVIPCSYDYPNPGKELVEFTGMWLDGANRRIVHSAGSNVLPQYLNRTKLTGNLSQKKCSLEIDPLRQSDQGPFAFRIQIAAFNNFSYNNGKVSISIISKHLFLSCIFTLI